MARFRALLPVFAGAALLMGVGVLLLLSLVPS